MFGSYRDGIPPYKLGTKKQLQREIHRSVKINGQVTLPHFPVSPTSLTSTSCLCLPFLFFPSNLPNSNFFLQHRWQTTGSRFPRGAALYFILFYFIFFRAAVVTEYYISFPPARFHIKAGVNERQHLHTASSSSSAVSSPSFPPVPVASVRAVNINLYSHLCEWLWASKCLSSMVSMQEWSREVIDYQ